MMTMALVLIAAAIAADAAGTRAGVTYRFENDGRSGTVWAAGAEARKETDAAGGGRGRVEIWKDYGRQVLVVDDADRVYYDQVAYLADTPRSSPALALRAATVSHPFEVADAKVLRIDVRKTPSAGGDCLPVRIDFAYILQLGVKGAPGGTFPARVEGVDDLCLVEALPVAALPFGHGLGLVTGIAAVDTVFAERLATVRGVPVRRKASVTRQIQGGQTMTSTLVVSDLARADVPSDRFEVPHGYRYREPVILPPTRQGPD